MKKAFTLIELLGVITILAVLAIPIIDSSVESNREELYKTQINQIEKAAKDYYTEHLNELPQNSGDKREITFKKLQDTGYLEMDIKNPRTNKNYAPTAVVIVTKEKENFKYEIKEW